jgi:hypothetical protein
MTLRKLTRIFALIEVSKVTALHGSAKFYSKKSNANSAMPQTVVALTARIKAVDSIDLRMKRLSASSPARREELLQVRRPK